MILREWQIPFVPLHRLSQDSIYTGTLARLSDGQGRCVAR